MKIPTMLLVSVFIAALFSADLLARQAHFGGAEALYVELRFDDVPLPNCSARLAVPVSPRLI